MEEIEQINELTQEIIKSAIDVHRELGPGLAESDYADALKATLVDHSLTVETSPHASIGKEVPRADTDCQDYLLIDGQVMLEIKSIDQLTRQNQDQLTACLVQSGYGVGLLINFNVENLELGIKRVINTELYDL